MVLRRPTACGFLAYSTRKEPSLNLLVLFRVPAIARNPFWITKGKSLLSGRSSLDDSTTRNLGQFVLVFVKHSMSESVSVSWSLSLRRLLECLGAMLCLLMIRHALSPPVTESNKGMHRSATPACVQQSSKRNILGR